VRSLFRILVGKAIALYPNTNAIASSLVVIAVEVVELGNATQQIKRQLCFWIIIELPRSLSLMKSDIFKISPKTSRQLIQFIQFKPLPIQNFKHYFAKLEKTITHLEKLKDNFLQS
jgi:hypothetical protein